MKFVISSHDRGAYKTVLSKFEVGYLALYGQRLSMGDASNSWVLIDQNDRRCMMNDSDLSSHNDNKISKNIYQFQTESPKGSFPCTFLLGVLNERNQYFATDSNRVVPSSLFSPKNCIPRHSLALGSF